MGIQLFSDLIDGFEKLLKGVKAIANLTQEERERYQQTLSEAYRLMNVTVTMVIVRLGDIRRMPDDKFLDEVARLDNYEEWLKTEREFRLCQSLRVAVRETETLPDKVKGAISIHD